APPPPRRPPPPVLELEPEANDFAELGEAEPPQRRGQTPGLAERYPQLGPVVEECLPRQWWIWLVGSAILLAITTPVAILAKSANNMALAVPAIILTIPNAGLLFFFAVFTFMSVKRRGLVCENGLIIQGLSGTTTCLW